MTGAQRNILYGNFLAEASRLNIALQDIQQMNNCCRGLPSDGITTRSGYSELFVWGCDLSHTPHTIVQFAPGPTLDRDVGCFCVGSSRAISLETLTNLGLFGQNTALDGTK